MDDATAPGSTVIAVTVTSAQPDPDGCWAVVDVEGRALRLPADAVDVRHLTLHPGQRLRADRAPDGSLCHARL